MLKRFLAAATVSASMLVTGTVAAQPTVASTPWAVAGETENVSKTTAHKKCRWEDRYGEWCRYCYEFGKWRLKYCRDKNNDDD